MEMLMGLLFVVTYLKLGWCWTLLEIDILVFGLVVVTFIDLDQMILPDVFTLPGIVVGLVGAALNPERSFLSALIGMALGGGFLWLTAYLYWIVRKAEGMGGGDIKLLAWIGAVLGLASVPFIILVSSLVGTFVGMIVAYRTKDGLKTAIPYGPYLAFAALAYLLGGSEITYWYWNFFVTDLGLLQS